MEDGGERQKRIEGGGGRQEEERLEDGGNREFRDNIKCLICGAAIGNDNFYLVLG